MANFFYSFHFYLFGILALASALVFVTRKSPVAAALWLVNTMFCLAALYVMLEAHFIGIIQVLVYAGAIMVVFLFVVMLLNLGHASELSDARGKVPSIVAGALGLALLALIGSALRLRVAAAPEEMERAMR
ncbi:MAG: NADH-quinone oxidoreductase subunit J family protein, partial [Gemmatimonadaceae bacterium]